MNPPVQWWDVPAEYTNQQASSAPKADIAFDTREKLLDVREKQVQEKEHQLKSKQTLMNKKKAEADERFEQVEELTKIVSPLEAKVNVQEEQNCLLKLRLTCKTEKQNAATTEGHTPAKTPNEKNQTP